jgi:4-alpha-glucanotransferase
VSFGVQTRYRDALDRWHAAGEETLVGVLRALGCSITGPGDAVEALAVRRAELADRRIEPVVVAWRGGPARTRLRMPAGAARGRVSVSVAPEPGEDGETVSWWVDPGSDPAARSTEGTVELPLRLPPDLPEGYHRLRVGGRGREDQALVIVAPERCAPPGPRTWGPFLPLYALRASGRRGVGDLGDLRELMEWTARLGGGVVATLPLFPTFLGCRGPFDPSPYAPVSRLFWNDLYLDVERLPELQQSPEAHALLDAPAFAAEVRRLQMVKLLDYRGVAAATERLLAAMVSTLRAQPSERRSAFEAFVRGRPDAVDYARFRAVTESSGESWRRWPGRLRDGRIRASDAPEDAVDRHLYGQWAMEEQLDATAAVGLARDVRLLADMPLGVHPDGYDTWRERAAFADGATAGAPPDPFFTRGQDWGFPPLHPDRVREQGYRYPIACLRTLMRRGSVMRIDHMMSQHRLFWIPNGMAAADGAYVRYPSDEWYAILTLESRRSGCALVGEDLGTVPAPVRPAMRRHGLLRTAVVQYEARPDPHAALPQARGAIAAVNTHDMPPFVAYWRALDVEDRLRRGLLDPAGAARERDVRARIRSALRTFLGVDGGNERAGAGEEGVPPRAEEAAVLRALLRHLSAGRAAMVLVNLEDLWGEVEPQNRPGTGPEEPNWRRRARLPLEVFGRDPALVSTLEGLTELRKGVRR